jgi:hypothetical protein
MKVNEMHVATSASSVTGLTPSLAAIPIATGGEDRRGRRVRDQVRLSRWPSI